MSKKKKSEFQCGECGSKHVDERVYTIKELEKLKEDCNKTFDTLANSFISKGQKFPSDFPSLEFFIDFLKIKELKSNETSRI